jgi:Na+-transporting NADH:ubiquinone oxidoreductase subunit C
MHNAPNLPTGVAPTPGAWLARLLNRPNESLSKTLFVSVAVCLACSFVVSTAAVLLGPRQAANRERDRKQQMAAILAAVPQIAILVETAGASELEARIVRLGTGEYADEIDPATYDQRKAAEDPRLSIELPPEHDVAELKRRPLYAQVYLLRDSTAQIQLVVLPVSGAGFNATMYGYVALGGDFNTIEGITFYEHEETPGLGGEIENPQWLAGWRGKRVRDETERIRVRVVEGKVIPGTPAAAYEVDAISGATWTSDGVSNLVRFWLGDDGFGPYIARLIANKGRDRR